MTSWIQVLSGRAFDLFSPKPDQLQIRDIAHSLAISTRFNGHTKRPYSIAEHSLLVVEILERAGWPRDVQLAGLMHEAAEAYIGDVVAPLKEHLPLLQDAEAEILRVAAERFGFTWPLPAAVLWADRAALGVERRYLLTSPSERAWGIDLPECDSVLKPWVTPDWQIVRDEFLARFDALGGVR